MYILCMKVNHKVGKGTDMEYRIPMENMEKLRKKVASITKKAAKYGVEITYKEIGAEVKEFTNDYGKKVYREYMVVEAEGEAKAEGWVFVGTIEHTPQGNILRSVNDDLKIPEKFKDAAPYCEHCKTRRARKDTYVVYEEEFGIFKQVGKSCLKEYTKGLNADMAAFLLQWIDEVEHFQTGGSSFVEMYNVTEVSKYFVETMRKLGWRSSAAEESTKSTAMDFYMLDKCPHKLGKATRERVQKEADEINFNASNITDEYINEALDWARNWNENEYNDYRQNLKVIASMEYCKWKHLGYLASLFMAYDKEMEREVKRAEQRKNRLDSEFIGCVGDKVTAIIKEWKCLSSWSTEWGVTYLYEFITDGGDVVIWKTSKWLDDEAVLSSISGKIKAHNEYNGVKQTELTRCKVAAKAATEPSAKDVEENKRAMKEVDEALGMLYA